jgi:hypothetical protein
MALVNIWPSLIHVLVKIDLKIINRPFISDFFFGKMICWTGLSCLKSASIFLDGARRIKKAKFISHIVVVRVAANVWYCEERIPLFLCKICTNWKIWNHFLLLNKTFIYRPYALLFTVDTAREVEHAVAQWLRHCATNWKVAGSIPDGVIKIFHWHNPSGRTMALGSTQPLTKMSTRNISWG